MVFNDTDAWFAKHMIEHHNQAITMAETILAIAAVDPRVTSLAQQIKAAQAPEITRLDSWVAAWGATNVGVPGRDMSTGSLSDADLTAFDSATGSVAGKLFLQQMTQHHQGAVGTATVELESGQNPDALDLAAKIIADQTAQIAEMRAILDSV
jgi:uncharacterized protein (DUF305 family)